MNEKVIETKSCKQCNSNFEITDKDLEFYEKVSPVFNSKKYIIPAPTLCPVCRDKRRLCTKNIGNLYKWWDWLISAYSPDKWLNVVVQKDWFSDKIDGTDFWKKIDFKKSFFTQFNELQKVAPRWNLIQYMSENCEWTTNVASCKNWYMIKSTAFSEDCLYWERILESNDIVDSYIVTNSNNCYELIDWEWCNNVYFSEKVINSNNSYYLFDSENLSYCIWCVWLKNKKFYILNKEYSESEFGEFRSNLLNNKENLELFLIDFNKLKKSYFRKWKIIINSENCIWDEIYNSKNIIEGFSIKDSTDSKYIDTWSNTRDSYDAHSPDDYDLTYETSTSYKLYKSLFIYNSLEIENCLYLETCSNLKNCFWCVWLKDKQYCILNQQYTKEEYNVLVPKIIEYMKEIWEYWEFFPSYISPFWYNETVAQEYFPLNEEEAINKWFNWSNFKQPLPKVEKIISAKKIPENISVIPDDILNWAIECDITKKPFRIIPKELEFYRKHNLPIPIKHPDQRHLERMKKRNPRKLYDRKCDKCGIDIKTTYSPNREEIIYCEECYNKVIY